MSMIRTRTVSPTGLDRCSKLGAACGVLIALSGCGGHSAAQPAVSARIEVTTWTGKLQRQTHIFTLGCDPTSGTLPLAARVCGDIGRHPTAMLDPAKERSVCLGGPFMPDLTVRTIRQGRRASFGGSPFCDWPGGTALGIYWAASRNDTATLAKVEPRLRCDDDPVLLEKPTPWASVEACMHGLWTPHSERLIKTAEGVPAIAELQPTRLFPSDIGARRCNIPAGGPIRRSPLAGKCGVSVKNAWSHPTVTFVEDWRAGGRTVRHRWQVRISGTHATLLNQTGPIAPQLWR